MRKQFEIYVPPNGRGFSAKKCYLPPLLSEFLMLGFTRLAGVPCPVASAALPSLRSSIIYGASARIGPEIPTRHPFTFFCSGTQIFQSC